MLRSKYSGITFYVHNLGKFDSVFIISTLLRYNYKNKTDHYKIETVRREAIILKLKIKCGSNSITILDSYRVLTDNLKNLSIKYKVDVTKGDFPYKFASVDNLFYVGQTPNVNYYPATITKQEYKFLFKELWDFKTESLAYLWKDLISLYQILIKVNKTLFLDFDIDMTKCLTISKLAYEIFTKHYLSEENNENSIPLINKKTIYRDIKPGYFGGMTEVYKPYGTNLYYYDVNSLYPYVGLNDMVGTKCKKIDYISGSTNIDGLFGFFYCDVESPKNAYLGLLPVRTKTGNIFPFSCW